MRALLIAIIGGFLNVMSFISKRYAANTAIALFSKPRKGKITVAQQDFLDTAFQEELKYQNHAIMTYRWLGKKETILLVHGWESNSGRWKDLVSGLSRKDYNIIALDAPAHGHSGSKMFNAFLYSEFINVVANQFKPRIVIGHSVGGMATAFCRNGYGLKSVQKLVLIGAPSEFTGVLKRYTDMMGYNQRIVNEIDAIIIERLGAGPASFSTAKCLESNTAKGLIIHDETDAVIPFGDAIQIQNSFKNSKLVSTKGMGHSLNNPTVASYIFDFIEA